MNSEELVAQNLKIIRTEKGLTQQFLAEKCDVSVQTIRDIEAGRRNPSIEMLEKIAGQLNVLPARFFYKDAKLPFDPNSPYDFSAPVIKVSQVLGKLGLIPDEIYDLAQDLEGDSAAWANIKLAFENEIKSYKRRKESSRKAVSNP